MYEPNLNSMAALVNAAAISDFGISVDKADVEKLLRDVLYEPRYLAQALDAGLVSRLEVAQAIAAHVHTLLTRSAGRSLPGDGVQWDTLIAQLEAALSQDASA